ncbi:Serine/threonine-protein phosphatase PP2A-5 catalytic subunit [Symbiodinium microadriaticum]|uniref:Serine/threonine-protein phosphatase PP2A-5 catalytic subunit n=1 Tax=Symbiodinium microadriaticum TaxID=2951 RepID=A0A1Q9E8W1_SYMMI|nr:Serine/threonine-protein phosphatase PP2A-5 catalytic subunit [Symbiodinium microadriaticum]
MVWADPHEGSGWAASPRGAGAWRFGRDIALQFLYSNGLKRLLRGHEQMAKGISTIWLDTKSEYAVQTVFSAADYVGTFCVDKTTNRPLRLPAWEPQMFNGGGQRNHGGMMVVDHSAGSRMNFHECILSGKEARKLAKTFTGAHCHHAVSASATRSPKTAPSTATTTTRRTSPTTTTTTGGNQGFLPDNSSPATTTTTARPTAATATPSTTEAGATNTVETGGSAVEKTTTTEESEAHPYSEGTTKAMGSQENAHSEETVMEPAPAPAPDPAPGPGPDPALAASPTAEHADSEETTTAMEAEEHADSEETTTTTTIDMWYWQHDDSEDDTTTPELGWKDKFKSYFGLALLEERVNDPETEQVELPIHCRDRLSQNETQEHEDYVHSILVAAEDMQFEARKIIDLQGEAAVCDDPQQASSENCKAMARDVITLKVFMDLKGSKQVVEDLQDNMVAREEEVEVASRASQEYWPASGFSGLIDLVFLVAEPISPTPEHFPFSAVRGGDKASVASASLEHVARGYWVLSFQTLIRLATAQLAYPHREKAEALLVSASDILREATYLFDGGGEFHLPRDPRKVGEEGDTKDDVLGDVYDQLEYVSGDMAATLLIRDIQKELIRAAPLARSATFRPELKPKAVSAKEDRGLIREYHPDQNPGREEEVRPVHLGARIGRAESAPGGFASQFSASDRSGSFARFEYCLRMLRLCKDVT